MKITNNVPQALMKDIEKCYEGAGTYNIDFNSDMGSDSTQLYGESLDDMQEVVVGFLQENKVSLESVTDFTMERIYSENI